MSMFDRLEDTLRRYEDVTAELGNPDIVTDQDKFRKYMKEQSNLAPIVEAYTEYKASKQNNAYGNKQYALEFMPKILFLLIIPLFISARAFFPCVTRHYIRTP